jgi:hypothetical protein
MRLRAIYKAMYHGLMPYWVYEKQRHYDRSYIRHLWINLSYAFRWATFRELDSDIEFKKQINNIIMKQGLTAEEAQIEHVKDLLTDWEIENNPFHPDPMKFGRNHLENFALFVLSHYNQLPAPANTQADEDVRDYEASDKATSIVPCDAPVDSK